MVYLFVSVCASLPFILSLGISSPRDFVVRDNFASFYFRDFVSRDFVVRNFVFRDFVASQYIQHIHIVGA